jgi:hypothetical protein
MFTTNQIYRLPWRFDEESAEWRAVELSLNLPWFLVEVENGHEKLLRTFFFSSLLDVSPIVEGAATDMTCVSMSLVLPPEMSNTQNWLFVPIQKISLELTKDGSKPDLVLTGKDGVHYGDNPFHPFKKDVGILVTMFDFK